MPTGRGIRTAELLITKLATGNDPERCATYQIARLNLVGLYQASGGGPTLIYTSRRNPGCRSTI